MKTGRVQDPGDGSESYLEVDCWTPWQYYVPEEELEPYYRDVNGLMMKLERMPPGVRARLERVEIRCPVKGCLLAAVYCVPRRPTSTELEHERRVNRRRERSDPGSKPQVTQPSQYLYVGRTAGGAEVYDLVDYTFPSIECTSGCILYWRAGCRHGTASISHAYIYDMFSIAGCWRHSSETEEDAITGLPEHLRPFWGKRVFHPEPSAWHPKQTISPGRICPAKLKRRTRAAPRCVRAPPERRRNLGRKWSWLRGIPAAAARSWVPGPTPEGARQHALQ
jgi:hypothetical protein